MSPDPYGGSYDVNNPQSMNRYSYTMNGPLADTDPSGLYMAVCPPQGCGGIWGSGNPYGSNLARVKRIP